MTAVLLWKTQGFQQRQEGKVRRGISLYGKKQIRCMKLLYRTDDKHVESLYFISERPVRVTL